MAPSALETTRPFLDEDYHTHAGSVGECYNAVHCSRQPQRGPCHEKSVSESVLHTERTPAAHRSDSMIAHIPSGDAALAASRLASMRSLEEGPYRPPGDYLSHARSICPPSAVLAGRRRSRGRPPVDASCRSAMIDWTRSVCDYCDFSPDIVTVTFSILDRYLATASGMRTLFDRDRYQLCSLAAFYTAVKINEPEVMGPEIVAGLSRGAADGPEDVIRTETEMLNAVGWRATPPTAASFAAHYFALLPPGLRAEMGNHTDVDDDPFAMAKTQCEASVRDYDLSTGALPSTIALGALLNAFESWKMSRVVNAGVYAALITSAGTAMGVEDVHSHEIDDVRRRLAQAEEGRDYYEPRVDGGTDNDDASTPSVAPSSSSSSVSSDSSSLATAATYGSCSERETACSVRRRKPPRLLQSVASWWAGGSGERSSPRCVMQRGESR